MTDELPVINRLWLTPKLVISEAFACPLVHVAAAVVVSVRVACVGFCALWRACKWGTPLATAPVSVYTSVA